MGLSRELEELTHHSLRPMSLCVEHWKRKETRVLDPMEMILLEMMRKPTGEENPGIPCLIL
jgi:hypothetical protein